MTTLVLQLTEHQARDVARVADMIGAPDHSAVAREAVRLLVRAVLPQKRRGRPAWQELKPRCRNSR